MSSNATVCRSCGLAVREADATIVVAGVPVHTSCAEAEHLDGDPWHHTGIDTSNQLARGAIAGGATL